MRSEPAFELAGAVEDADQAILVAARELPDVASSTCACRAAAPARRAASSCARPHTGVLAFSAHDDPLTMQEMCEAGADGYLVKGSPVTTIIASIRSAGDGTLDVATRKAA